MDREYYKDYATLERTHWWFLVRRDIILNHLRSLTQGQKGLKILNVGAATGYSSEFLQEFGEVTSVEYDKECCAFVRNKYGKEFVNASITELPFSDEAFDLVCAFDVIEHIADDYLAVRELKRVTHQDGKICVTVPAFNFLWSQHDDINHHFRRYTRTNFKALFASTGRIVKATYFNTFLFFPIAFFRMFNKGGGDEASKSDFGVAKNSFASSLARWIFSLEKPLLSLGLSFPVGVSILLSWKREK
ncbi:MAG: methyltransferase domain-containing protein [Cyclobacteriaceae bacterium]|nr:methyltransferase domain-containing protein [Cyclobacteriaceae bacterium]